MATLRSPFFVICLGVMSVMPAAAWGQSDTSNAQKVEALQKQLDDMKEQMANVQAQILELSKATPSTTPAAKTAVTAGATTPQQEEGGAAQAAALGVVPAHPGRPQ